MTWRARIASVSAALALASSCGDAVAPEQAPSKSTAEARAARRLYDGSPPAIPHIPVGADCIACHNEHGLDVPGLGFAPPSPHERTAGMSAMSRCEQCHVYKTTDESFRANDFVGLAQDLRLGSRLYGGAPPVIPHLIQMRENCQACHAGPAAREAIRCSHPERARCTQCHVEQSTRAEFARGL